MLPFRSERASSSLLLLYDLLCRVVLALLLLCVVKRSTTLKKEALLVPLMGDTKTMVAIVLISDVRINDIMTMKMCYNLFN